MKYLLDFRWIKVLSYCLARKLQIHLKEPHYKRYVYYYGAEAIIGQIFEILLVISISAILGTFKETIIALISFISIRLFAGGGHLDNYTKCLYSTNIVFILAGLISKYILVYRQTIDILYIIALMILLLFAPKEHSNRPIKEKEHIKFKSIAIMNLGILYFISNFCLESFRESIIIGIMIACVVILPIRRRNNG